MPYVLLFLSILFTSAQATIPLRLVTEIQLPARTVTWDVQHVEDSTSYGWAALTNGETVWGIDSLGWDYVISTAVDTIWYQTNLAGDLEQYHFSREGFNPNFDNLHWSGLTLVKLPSVPGLSAIARMVDGWNDSYDQYLYYLHLQGDSVLHTQMISMGGFDSYHIIDIDASPNLPQPTQAVLLLRTESQRYDITGCSVSAYHASSIGFRLDNFSGFGIPGIQIDHFDRTDSISFAFLTGSSTHYNCEDEPPYYDNSFIVGSLERNGVFNSVIIDTFETSGRVVAQEDFDGTKRIFYSNGNCYNAATGAVEFTNPAIADTTLSAYVRNAPGEDFLVLQNSRFLVYDGRTGVLVDSTTVIQGVPQKKFVSSGFDELLTYDAAQKLVRIYRPFETLLSIQATENGNVLLSWTPSPGATSYRLDRSDDPDFNNFFPDYFAPTITSIEFQPTASVEFFRVTPIFD